MYVVSVVSVATKMHIKQKPSMLRESMLTAIQLWCSDNDDNNILNIISEEGKVIKTNTCILTLHSKQVRDVLENSLSSDITVPASATLI